MKKLIIISIALFCLAAMVTAQTAAPAATPAAPAPKAASAKMESFTGTIVSVDTATKQIVVKNSKEESKTFTVKKTKKYKVDENVTVKHKTGSDVAEAIIVAKKAAAKKAEPAAAPAPAPAK